MAKPFSRKGLHKLECQVCDGFLYATVAMLEAKGLPPCWCGSPLQPTELDLAMILGAEESRPLVEYRRECNRVAKGQAPHGRAGRELKRTPEQVAAERVEISRRATRSYRRAVPEALPF